MEYFNTFGGNPVSCEIGLVVVDVMEREGLQRQALDVGAHLLRGLSGLADRHPLVGDVRGLGPMEMLIEMVSDDNKTPAAGHALAVIKRSVANGVLLIRAGLYSNCVRFMDCPSPTEDQVREGLSGNICRCTGYVKIVDAILALAQQPAGNRS